MADLVNLGKIKQAFAIFSSNFAIYLVFSPLRTLQFDKMSHIIYNYYKVIIIILSWYPSKFVHQSAAALA